MSYRNHAETKPTIKRIIEQLNLSLLKDEFGLYVRVYEPQLKVDHQAKKCLPIIYYALTPEYPQDNLHWLATYDHHVPIEGGSTDYYYFMAMAPLK
tara:strand:- start:1968 stop:2255 length:288 start_codon:yes stop_codon:yes gene_type:complete